MSYKRTLDFERKLETIKQAIILDTETGIIPEIVGSFSELHDYVDANEYVILAYDNNFPFNQKGYREANRLLDIADRWLNK